MSTILVVDDDEALKASVIDILEDEGHNVTGASNSIAALNSLQTQHFDLIITDVVMPEEDGIFLLRKLEALNIDSKIIVMSGGGKVGAADTYLNWAKKLHADGTLKKPFTSEALYQMIEQLNIN